MKLILLVCAIGLCQFSHVNAQNAITKILLDKESYEPIKTAHVYLNNHLKTGTITNEDGRFIIWSRSELDSINISHVSYLSRKYAVADIKSDTIFLPQSNNTIDEVMVCSLSGTEILKRAIDSLEANHAFHPIYYNAYVRVLKYELDYSKLHVMSEYDMSLYQKNKSTFKFQINKTRAAPFSDTGKKYFKDMRMTGAISIISDNIYKWQEDFFNKRKIKKYAIKIIGHEKHEGKVYYKLSCNPINAESDYAVLLVDMNSYGIKKITKYYSQEKDEFDEVTFKQIDGKWFLQSSKRSTRDEI